LPAVLVSSDFYARQFWIDHPATTGILAALAVVLISVTVIDAVLNRRSERRWRLLAHYALMELAEAAQESRNARSADALARGVRCAYRAAQTESLEQGWVDHQIVTISPRLRHQALPASALASPVSAGAISTRGLDDPVKGIGVYFHRAGGLLA
jgi:hypothetical protein